MKAKTALASGGTIRCDLNLHRVACGQRARLVRNGRELFFHSRLLIVFSWRSTKTLHKIFELIPSQHPDLNGKGIAFLIISLMAVVSIFVLILQTRRHCFNAASEIQYHRVTQRNSRSLTERLSLSSEV